METTPETITPTLTVRVNGSAREISSGLTLEQLLAQLQIRNPAIAVEINRQLVIREDFAETVLQANDEIEIVTLAGGG